MHCGYGLRLCDFNSRTSCEVRQWEPHFPRQPAHFNSRTSCEVRQPPKNVCFCCSKFQLTHLLRGATKSSLSLKYSSKISTHAPLARCDKALKFGNIGFHNFNSRTSCEVRQYINHNIPLYINISTHAPLARCDTDHHRPNEPGADFNSRTSCEVRHQGKPYDFIGFDISTHAPLARCDIVKIIAYADKLISTHAPLARCDLEAGFTCQAASFQLTHLLRGATGQGTGGGLVLPHFNSRTSCEVRLPSLWRSLQPRHNFNSRTSCEVRHATSGMCTACR